MSKASDFKYKWHDDDRSLGPPHQRFPDMHPEDDMPVKNVVFLEIPTVGLTGIGMPALAGVFIYVSILCFLTDILTWNFLMVKTSVIWAIAGIGGVGILLSLLTRPPMPFRLNRITQELIISNGEQVARIPWEKVPARISRTLNARCACFDYALQFGFGPTPEEVQAWGNIAGHAHYEEDALRCWEYFCRYMESPDGHVALRKTPDHEKSAARKMWDADHESAFTKFCFLLIFPAAWITAESIALNKRKHKPWPQEALDICENHPLLKGKKLDG
ncbi:MAG: hypothetical protein WBB23_12370 [Desulforhopalus sp.]